MAIKLAVQIALLVPSQQAKMRALLSELASHALSETSETTLMGTLIPLVITGCSSAVQQRLRSPSNLLQQTPRPAARFQRFPHGFLYNTPHFTALT